jgi:uncharacterized OsmC-like protein
VHVTAIVPDCLAAPRAGTNLKESTPMTIDTTTTTTTTSPLAAVLDATERAVQADPAAAAALFKAAGSSTGPVTTTIALGRHTVQSDEPASLGGQDGAPNPVEYALASLLSCQAVTYRVWAVKLGIEVEDIDISIEGDLDARGFFGLDEATRPGFGQVRVAVQVRGPETPQRYAELQAAVDAHCPVLDLFTNPTTVRTALTVV